MSDQDDQPDHTEDPRKQDTGPGGYPESTHPGAGGDDEDQRTGTPPGGKDAPDADDDA
jgi:hypothetical protein